MLANIDCVLNQYCTAYRCSNSLCDAFSLNMSFDFFEKIVMLVEMEGVTIRREQMHFAGLGEPWLEL